MSNTSLWDVVGYLTYANPVSQALINTTVQVAKGTQNLIVKPTPPPEPIILPLTEYTAGNYNFIRLAGISGAAAILLSVYGNSYINAIEDVNVRVEAKRKFDAASKYHFVHTCALFTIPLARRPLWTGSLIVIGIAMLGGSMYYRALTDESKLKTMTTKRLKQLTTCGGFCLFAAWLSLIF